jgi:hypothetical protein
MTLCLTLDTTNARDIDDRSRRFETTITRLEIFCSFFEEREERERRKEGSGDVDLHTYIHIHPSSMPTHAIE